MFERLPFVLGSLVLFACAAHTQHRPEARHAGDAIAQFPSNAALQDIAHKSQGTPLPEFGFGGHDRWQLASAPASQTSEPSAVLALGPELAARARGQYSEALGCVAHEFARALAEQGTLPGLSVRRFVAGRCGAWISRPSARSWLMTAPAGVDTAQLEAQARSALNALSPEQIGLLAGMHVGLGVARVGDKLALVAAYGAPLVELEDVPRYADAAGKVTLRGRLSNNAWLIQAYINRGPLGVSECELDPAFALPAFSATCSLDEADDYAWVQLLAVPPGRLVGNSVLEILALRTPEAAHTYQAPTEIAGAAAKTQGDFAAAALSALNAVRGKAGMAPLSYAAAQSEVASQVTLPFYQSLLTHGQEADATNNAIMLGLLAGWSVQGGTIQAAQLVANLSDRPEDAARWLASALELPSGRAVLLDPEASALALGLNMQSQGVAGVAVAYRFTDPYPNFDELTLDLLERLKSVREARKLGNTVFITNTPGMEAGLRGIRDQGQTPEKALHAVLDETSRSLGRGVQGFAWQTYALEGIEFPDALLQPGDLYLGAGITQYKPENAAWAQYAVLFAVVSPR